MYSHGCQLTFIFLLTHSVLIPYNKVVETRFYCRDLRPLWTWFFACRHFIIQSGSIIRVMSQTLQKARKWEKFAYRQNSIKEQLFFLHECLSQNVLPSSIRYKIPINYALGWKKWSTKQLKNDMTFLGAHFRLNISNCCIVDNT